ncbi:MAG: CRTAC1 family protein [Bryobacteraceae bacterium]
MKSRLLLLIFIGAAFPAAEPPPLFTNSTQAAGINFVHAKGNKGAATILEEAGPGVCVADYDSDGWQDIYFVNGRGPHSLYRNNQNGTFTDVTTKAGVAGNAYGLGCVWGDYDNDGHPDLYVSQYGHNILYRNNGDGSFTDVTAKAGVDGAAFGTVFHTGATFFDYDKDGFLDLYTGGYVDFGPQSRQTCKLGSSSEASCPPSVYSGSPAVLYRNNADGTFTNVTRKAGIYQPKGKNLSVQAVDYDNDGWPDLMVANDGVEAYLYHNEHNGTFKEVALTSGVALSGDGLTMAAMCISFGDYDNDGNLDLYISDFQNAPDHIWHNDGHGFFDEVSVRAGIAVITKSLLSFGGGFFDYDNDGLLDLFIANGHVYQGVEAYKQINSLFHNEGRGKFIETAKQSGEAFTVPHLGRGAAFFDYDNDGFMDVVVGNNDDPPLLLHNNGVSVGHYLNLQLVGTKSNRDAMGARVKVTAGGITQMREIAGGGSYLSQSDLRAHVGLKSNKTADVVEVWWPSGAHQLFQSVEANHFYTITEGRAPILVNPGANRAPTVRESPLNE